jgi:Rrf2 family protein
MFRISRKADYAVLIMCQLALRERQLRTEAEHAEAESLPPISAQEIASGGELSKSLTANIMKVLTRHGLLESVRGVSGGYRLAGNAQDITLSQILEAVEGPLALVECASHISFQTPVPKATSHTSQTSENCALTHCCPSRRAMRVVHQRIANLFDEITLSELIEMDTPVADLIGAGNQENAGNSNKA